MVLLSSSLQFCGICKAIFWSQAKRYTLTEACFCCYHGTMESETATLLQPSKFGKLNLKKALYVLLILLIVFSIGGYFLFARRKDLILRYTPDVYWRMQEERTELDAPQVSGKVIGQEDNILIIDSAKGNTLNFLIPPTLKILRFHHKMEKEEITFEEIERGDYVLILPATESFYGGREAAQEIFVSSSPIFSKVEKYETD